MATTYELIASTTVGSGGASSVTLGSGGTIPQTYTDLLVKFSARGSDNSPTRSANVTVNNATSYANTYLQGNGAVVGSGTNASGTTVFYSGEFSANQNTASTFGNTEFYIPNYTNTSNKSVSVDSVSENNGTYAYATFVADLINTSAAISSITITPAVGNFEQYSTFYLYGIKNS